MSDYKCCKCEHHLKVRTIKSDLSDLSVELQKKYSYHEPDFGLCSSCSREVSDDRKQFHLVCCVWRLVQWYGEWL